MTKYVLQVTDAGLVALGGLSALENLTLWRAKGVREEGMQALARRLPALAVYRDFQVDTMQELTECPLPAGVHSIAGLRRS
eukprot:1726723-Pyramimonas_sp.AAC.2